MKTYVGASASADAEVCTSTQAMTAVLSRARNSMRYVWFSASFGAVVGHVNCSLWTATSVTLRFLSRTRSEPTSPPRTPASTKLGADVTLDGAPSDAPELRSTTAPEVLFAIILTGHFASFADETPPLTTGSPRSLNVTAPPSTVSVRHS